MTTSEILKELVCMQPDELLIIKSKLITSIDKKKYAKEVLSSLDDDDARKTIEWIKKKYDI